MNLTKLFPWRGSSSPTGGDLIELFGEPTARRVLVRPMPGMAIVDDVIAVYTKENRQCELINGVLIERVRQFRELAFVGELILIFRDLYDLDHTDRPGFSNSMLCLNPGVVLIPDIAFFEQGRIPAGQNGTEPLLYLSPDLAVEILSPNNVRADIKRKLRIYFSTGTKLVWCLDPVERTVRVHKSPEIFRISDESGTLDGGEILPGFRLLVRDWFTRAEGQLGGPIEAGSQFFETKSMTEAEWIVCVEPWSLIEYVERGEHEASTRKLLLCGVACCRRARFVTTDPRHHNAIEAAEKLADGLMTEQESEAIFQKLKPLWGDFRPSWGDAPAWENPETPFGYMSAATFHLESRGNIRYATDFAARAIAWNAGEDVRFYRFNKDGPISDDEGLVSADPGPIQLAERSAQVRLIRDIIGNPFRPVIFHPSWLDPTVISLARMIYDQRAFDRMPQLGDALQAAGCTNDVLLAHCREGGEHVRGCWVLDHLLEKW